MKRNYLLHNASRAALFIAILFITQNAAKAQSANVALKASAAENPEIKKLLQYYDKQIYFTENKGQWPVSVLFKADFPLGQAVATKEGMMVGSFDPASIAARSADVMKEEKAKKKGLPYKLSEGSIKGHAWMMNFVNHSASMSVETQSMHKDFFNYVQSGNSKPVMNVSNYQEVWYKDVYDKVDVRYYPSATGTLEYDIVCKPGFNKKDIAIRYEGIDKITLEKNGGVALKTSVGDMEFPAPVAYQRINGKQKSIEAEYELIGNNVLTFKVSKFDASQPLIIDPIALRWATWITNNSQGDDHGHCIWVDPNSNSQSIYIAARILGTGLITTPGAFDNSYNGDASGSTDDIVLGKYIQPDSVGGAGTRVWQTYYGGHDEDNPYAMEQGPDGNLYVTGLTGSQNFPMSGSIDGDNTFSSEPAGIDDRSQITSNNNDKIFVLKFDTTGTAFKAAVIGGNGDDDPFDIRITQYGDIYVCGYTNSTNLANAGLHMTRATSGNNGGIDCFVFKINSLLDSIYWFSNYGGSGADQNNIMLHDPGTGNLFVGGQTKSTDFPVTNPRQGERGGSEDGFLQKMDSNGVVIWSSYFNSAKGDSTTIICMEFNTTRDKLYFGGITEGLDTTNINILADTLSEDTTYNGGNADFFVALMDTAQNLLKSTYLGGKGSELNMMGLNVDLKNDVYIFGYSNSSNFPVTSDALQSTLNPGAGNNALATDHDMTFTKLYYNLDSVIYSTFYGGGIDDYDPVGERGIKFSQCRIYTIVTAGSQNIPLTAGALTTNKLSGSTQNNTTYEPGLMVWANPPDLTNNTIFGSQRICAGTTPSNLTGSLPSYVLPQISRNGNITAYPDSFGNVYTFQWQYSTDSINWKDVPGGTTQNLAGSLIPITSDTTYLIRVINGDACIGLGMSDEIVLLLKFAAAGTVTNVTCFGMNNGSVTINPVNGTPPYQYSWSPGGQTTSSITNQSPGTYKVVVQDATGCTTDTTSFTISQPSAPLSATKSSTNSACNKNTGSATVYPSGGTTPYYYSWNTGATSSSITSLPQGTYTVTISDSNDCSIIVVDTVTNFNGPAAPIVNDVDNCGSSTVSTTATGTLLWNTGETTSSITVTVANTYTVTQTDNNGCTSIPGTGTSAPLSIPDVPTVSDTDYCGSSVLSTTATGSLLWSTGETTSSITVTTAGTYSVTVTAADNCPSSPGTGVAAPYPIPDAPSVKDLDSCGSSTLYTTATGSLLWSTGETTSSITVTAAGTYSVTVTNSSGCTSSPGTGAAAPLSIPDPPSVEDDDYCGSSVLSTTAAGSLLWNTGETTSSITVTVAGSYSVTVTNSNGCSAAGTGTAAPMGVPAAPSVTDVDSCGSSTLSTTATGLLLWSTGETTSSITVTAAGTYSVTQTAPDDCPSAPGTGVAAPYTVPDAPSVKDVDHCGSSTLSTTATGNLLWSTGETSSSITVTAAGSYSVTVSNSNACTSSPGTGTAAPLSIPDAPSVIDADYCGSSVLSTTATGSLLWNTGETTSSITVTVAGTYSVTQSAADGCTSSAGTGTAAPLGVPAAPSVTDLDSCGSSTLSTTATGLLLWSTGETTSSITVTAAGTYSVTQTAYDDCPSAPGTGVAAPYTIPASPSVKDVDNCGSSTLSTTTTGKLLWSTGATTSSITVTAAGTYSVTVINGSSCTSSPGTGTAAPLGIPSMPSVQDADNCGSSTLSTTATGSLLWSTGATTSSITVTAAGTYTVTLTAGDGCSSPGSGKAAPLGVPPAPSVKDVDNCGSSTLSTTATGSLLWSTGETTSSITVTAAGTYSVTQTVNGCISPTGTGTAAPMENPPPCNITGKNVICKGSSTSLCGPDGAGLKYLWTGGIKTRCRDVSKGGTYDLTVTTSSGCVSKCNASVRVLDVSCDISGVAQIVKGGTTSLCAPAGYTSYKWSTGATTRCITVHAIGVYSVKVSNSSGCNSTCSVSVILCASRLSAGGSSDSTNDGGIKATAYPNPFSTSATIEFSNSTGASHMQVEVYMLDGSKVATLFDENTEEGIVYKAEFDAANLSEGIYIYRIISDSEVINGKLILLKH